MKKKKCCDLPVKGKMTGKNKEIKPEVKKPAKKGKK